MSKNFALIGAAGYIAPRHMDAIKKTDNNLIAAFDPYDGIGIIDSFFPESNYFSEFERFDRFLDLQKREGNRMDYLSICSPNYLHDSHIRFGLKSGANVICEKPLVLNTWNIDALKEVEAETGNKVNTILQLRLHESIIDLKKKIDNGPKNHVYKFNLEYITSRGKWYQQSWKGNEDKSGGIATNIGIHFFDMLTWIFGDLIESRVIEYNRTTARGILVLEKAEVNWLLSIDYNNIPENVKREGVRTYRNINIEGEQIEFSKGFTELHLRSYENILQGNGFGLSDAYNAVKIAQQIREGIYSK